MRHILLLLALLTSTAPKPMLQPLPSTSTLMKPMVCPCEFEYGKAIAGKTVLVIDHNSKQQTAIVNTGGRIARLPHLKPFRFQCRKGESVAATWQQGDLRLSVQLTVDGPGEESCWFRGKVYVREGRRSDARAIVGACGC